MCEVEVKAGGLAVIERAGMEGGETAVGDVQHVLIYRKSVHYN
jgi:hypothetical protein